MENLTILTVQKSAGVLMSRAKDQNAEDTTEEDANEGDDGKEGNKKRKAIAQAVKQQRNKDEEVLGVFVSRSSLAASMDPEEQASADIDVNLKLSEYRDIINVDGHGHVDMITSTATFM